MWPLILVIIVSVCVFGADASKDNSDAIKKDELQGTWSVVSTTDRCAMNVKRLVLFSNRLGQRRIAPNEVSDAGDP